MPAHLLRHVDVPRLPTRPEDVVDFLVSLTITANKINPHISFRLLPEVSGELEPDLEEVSSETCLDSLSFDIH